MKRPAALLFSSFALVTPRLLLEKHSLRDAPLLAEWWSSPALLELTSDSPPPSKPLSEERVKNTLETWFNTPPTKHLRFGIYWKDSRALIGYGAIACMDFYHRSCLLSLVLGTPQVRGKGLGSECLAAILPWCFEQLEMHRIGAEVFEHNAASLALFEKFGFQREGFLREAIRKQERYVGEWKLGLLRREWEETRTS